MASWCAAKKCPAQDNCTDYITKNDGNQTAQNFVACCEILCGRSANDMLVALRCGGATTATAWGIVFYLLLLLFAGAFILTVGPFVRAKSVTYWVVTIGSLIFTTGTGVFVTTATSPFRVLQSVPALGAMNVAVFFYFYSGFQYAVGLAYEGGPLFVFIATAFTIMKEVVASDPENRFMRDGNRVALAMLVVAFLWIGHSVSYRLYGYRVDWRVQEFLWCSSSSSRELRNDRRLNPNFQLGAAQGHPTWRTPMGQSSSVLLTALAWTVNILVKKDLARQRCRPDWVFNVMLYGAPCLISVTILWNVFSGTRCRRISKLLRLEQHPRAPDPEAPRRRPGRSFKRWIRSGLKFFSRPSSAPPIIPVVGSIVTPRETSRQAYYPGSKPYVDYKQCFSSLDHFKDWNLKVWGEYVQAAALQRMGRNTLFVERVPPNRLEWSDQIIGFLAWFSAQGGLVMSIPGFLILMLVTELLGVCFEFAGFRIMVETEVTPSDRFGLAKVVDECHVGKDLEETLDKEHAFTQMCVQLLGADEGTGTCGVISEKTARSINLHTLLDNTGPCELYSFQHQISGSADQMHHLSNGSHNQASQRH